jgi:RHS repeat-associated protein
VLEEYVTKGDLTATYVRGIALLLQDLNNGTQSYFVTDNLGSTRALTSPAGAVTDTIAYDAYGNVLVHNGATSVQFLYAGMQFDAASGQCYDHARYYDAEAGIFTLRDSYDGQTDDPITENHYAYVGADPTSDVDPNGHMSFSDVMVAMSIVSVTFSAINFAVNPNANNAAFLVFDIATFPAGFLKGMTALFGASKYLSVLKGFVASMNAIKVPSEVASMAWLRARGLTLWHSEQGFKTFLRTLGQAGQMGRLVDWVATDVTTGKFVLVEAKSVLNEAALTSTFGKVLTAGASKFESSIALLKSVWTGVFEGVQELVITAKSIGYLGPNWSIGPAGQLLYNGAEVIIEGVPVTVKLLTF